MNFVILSLFNSFPDPQYGGFWEADLSKLTVLPSLRRHDVHVVIINDCLQSDYQDDEHTTYVRVDNDISNAYFARWHHIAEYLDDIADPGYVWCIDGGDVLLLNNPFPSWLHPGALYIGCEPGRHDKANARWVGFGWMRDFHKDHAQWITEHAGLTLLNPGLVGGRGDIVRGFADELAGAWPTIDGTDMAAANRIAYSDRWRGCFVTGDRIHTPYWSYRKTDPHAIWAHK